jgi:hypothetical protein
LFCLIQFFQTKKNKTDSAAVRTWVNRRSPEMLKTKQSELAFVSGNNKKSETNKVSLETGAWAAGRSVHVAKDGDPFHLENERNFIIDIDLEY